MFLLPTGKRAEAGRLSILPTARSGPAGAWDRPCPLGSHFANLRPRLAACVLLFTERSVICLCPLNDLSAQVNFVLLSQMRSKGWPILPIHIQVNDS